MNKQDVLQRLTDCGVVAVIRANASTRIASVPVTENARKISSITGFFWK